MTEWQTIETAPKNGTDVLIYVPGLNRKVWVGSYNVHESICNGVRGTTSEGWNYGLLTTFGNKEPDPTHWMPIPAAPSQK